MYATKHGRNVKMRITLDLVLPKNSYCWYWNNGSGYYEYGGVITATTIKEAQSIVSTREFLDAEKVGWTDVVVCLPNQNPNN